MSPEESQRRLREALRAAMKARDTVAVSALRSVLAAIANAEAVTAPASGPGHFGGPGLFGGTAPGGSRHVAGSAAGPAAAEAPRRELTGADIAAIIAAEVTERRAVAGQFDSTGNAGRAARLRREAEVIEGCAQP